MVAVALAVVFYAVGITFCLALCKSSARRETWHSAAELEDIIGRED